MVYESQTTTVIPGNQTCDPFRISDKGNPARLGRRSDPIMFLNTPATTVTPGVSTWDSSIETNQVGEET